MSCKWMWDMYMWFLVLNACNDRRICTFLRLCFLLCEHSTYFTKSMKNWKILFLWVPLDYFLAPSFVAMLFLQTFSIIWLTGFLSYLDLLLSYYWFSFSWQIYVNIKNSLAFILSKTSWCELFIKNYNCLQSKKDVA